MLVDSSVWIDHLRRGDATLAALLEDGDVECHPFVIGELACGHLQRRAEILELLGNLPGAPIVGHDEALHFVDIHALGGRGLGWIDVHLLAAARLADVGLWTRDRRLAGVADELGVGL